MRPKRLALFVRQHTYFHDGDTLPEVVSPVKE
jgi:hypothetical protein